MLFWCLIFGFIGLSAKLKLSDLKAVKASIMCLTFHARVVHFFAMLKRTSIYKNYLWLLSQKIFSPSTPNLGAQIMFALSWYTAVQTDQKISPVFRKGLWFNCLIWTLWPKAGLLENNLLWVGQYHPLLSLPTGGKLIQY